MNSACNQGKNYSSSGFHPTTYAGFIYTFRTKRDHFSRKPCARNIRPLYSIVLFDFLSRSYTQAHDRQIRKLKSPIKNASTFALCLALSLSPGKQGNAFRARVPSLSSLFPGYRVRLLYTARSRKSVCLYYITRNVHPSHGTAARAVTRRRDEGAIIHAHSDSPVYLYIHARILWHSLPSFRYIYIYKPPLRGSRARPLCVYTRATPLARVCISVYIYRDSARYSQASALCAPRARSEGEAVAREHARSVCS